MPTIASPSPHRSYIIACTPRSGSHLLGGGLDSTAVAGHPTERFPRLAEDALPQTPAERDVLMQAWPDESYDAIQDAEYVKQIIQTGMSQNRVFGVIIHWFQLHDAVRRVSGSNETDSLMQHAALAAAFGDLSYVWLRRRDRVAQAVSWYRAIYTGEYVRTNGSAKNIAADKEGPEFNYERIQSYLSALTSFDNGWANYFASNRLAPLVVWYEDLSSNYVSTVRAVLEFLELDATRTRIENSRYKKIGDAESTRWITRFRAMQSVQRRG